MTAVADPLGGSWYVEALTRELEEKAWALIEEVEAHGGMTKAVAEGLPKHRIEEAAAERAARVDTGETVIVGVNRYRKDEEDHLDILEVDNAKVRAGQIERLKAVARFRRTQVESMQVKAGEGGVQEVRITVKGGYDPDVIVVKQGQPVRLAFYRDETASCSEQVVFGRHQARVRHAAGGRADRRAGRGGRGAGQRAHRQRHAQGPGRRGAGRPLQAGPVLPPQCHPHRRATAARDRRLRAAGPAVHRDHFLCHAGGAQAAAGAGASAGNIRKAAAEPCGAASTRTRAIR